MALSILIYSVHSYRQTDRQELHTIHILLTLMSKMCAGDDIAINTTCQSITQHFILYTITIVYCQGNMFRPLLGHLQALWETDPRAIYIKVHCRIPNA